MSNEMASLQLKLETRILDSDIRSSSLSKSASRMASSYTSELIRLDALTYALAWENDEIRAHQQNSAHLIKEIICAYDAVLYRVVPFDSKLLKGIYQLHPNIRKYKQAAFSTSNKLSRCRTKMEEKVIENQDLIKKVETADKRVRNCDEGVNVIERQSLIASAELRSGELKLEHWKS
ncbi:hypothetical protein QC760_010016 [Botrytis cinerea]